MSYDRQNAKYWYTYIVRQYCPNASPTTKSSFLKERGYDCKNVIGVIDSVDPARYRTI
ncbi:MAG: hypothetical protein WCR96_06585 [Candidatus Methanomethylophilaceae archaeon]